MSDHSDTGLILAGIDAVALLGISSYFYNKTIELQKRVDAIEADMCKLLLNEKRRKSKKTKVVYRDEDEDDDEDNDEDVKALLDKINSSKN